MTAKPIYLDYAAATPLAPEVLKAMQPYWQDRFYNPSATYLAAQSVAKDLQAARVKIAAQLGSRPTEIIFTAGGSEADNLAINGVMQGYPKAKLLVSAAEHEAVLQTAEQYNHQLIPVDANGVVDLKAFEKQIDDQTVLVSVMYANNEIGTIQPIKQIAQIIQAKRQSKSRQLPLYLHTDASQAGNYLDLHVSRLGIDLMTLNGGKMYGPKQSGALYVKAGMELAPQVRGGGQERGLRSGTENLASIAGLATALDLAQNTRAAEVKRLQGLQKQFIKDLQQQIPSAEITAPKANKLPNIVHVSIPKTDNERVIMQLDEAGIMAAVGSACSASDDEPSHVLKAVGFSDSKAQTSLRFSMGRATTAAELRTTVKTLAKLLA